MREKAIVCFSTVFYFFVQKELASLGLSCTIRVTCQPLKRMKGIPGSHNDMHYSACKQINHQLSTRLHLSLQQTRLEDNEIRVRGALVGAIFHATQFHINDAGTILIPKMVNIDDIFLYLQRKHNGGSCI